MFSNFKDLSASSVVACCVLRVRKFVRVYGRRRIFSKLGRRGREHERRGHVSIARFELFLSTNAKFTYNAINASFFPARGDKPKQMHSKNGKERFSTFLCVKRLKRSWRHQSFVFVPLDIFRPYPVKRRMRKESFTMQLERFRIYP